MPLEQFLPLQVYAFLLVFSRLAATVMLLPGIGEAYVPARLRLLFALLLAVIVAPLVSGFLPAEPTNIFVLFKTLMAEILIGVYIGIISRVLLLTPQGDL